MVSNKNGSARSTEGGMWAWQKLCSRLYYMFILSGALIRICLDLSRIIVAASTCRVCASGSRDCGMIVPVWPSALPAGVCKVEIHLPAGPGASVMIAVDAGRVLRPELD